MKKQWSIGAVAGLALVGSLVGSLAFVQAQGNGTDAQEPPAAQQEPPPAPVDGPSGQPIAFPHDRHAGDLQIDCQFCHFSAERSSTAGIPPVATCMGCHVFVAGTENPEEVAMLRGYWEREETIPWNRIYKVADHVQFPHMRHISAGVDCATCHGEVREIGVIQTVNQPLTMGWCVSCHMETGASRDCTVCHY